MIFPEKQLKLIFSLCLSLYKNLRRKAIINFFSQVFFKLDVIISKSNFIMKDLNIQHQSFWNQGNGRDFLKWADLEDTNLPKQNIDVLFQKYDHEVDDMVEKWLQDGSFKSIMKFLHHQQCEEKLPDNFLALSAEME